MRKMTTARSGDATQFGFGVGLKFSKKATRRNKVKRWMREAVRKKIEKITPGHRVIFLANPKYPEEKLNLEIIQKNKKHLPYRYQRNGDMAVYYDWLESYKVWNGSKKSRRGLPHFDHAFLSGCLWIRNLQFYPVLCASV